MKRTLLFVPLIFCLGCVSVNVPKYLPEKSPYTKTYYSDFDSTFSAVEKSLSDLGWRIADTANPGAFEQDKAAVGPDVKQVLIFTEVRQTPLILASRYMNLNIYIRSADKSSTDVEVRYISVTPTGIKNIKGYKNDEVVNKLLSQIAQYLQK